MRPSFVAGLSHGSPPKVMSVAVVAWLRKRIRDCPLSLARGSSADILHSPVPFVFPQLNFLSLVEATPAVPLDEGFPYGE